MGPEHPPQSPPYTDVNAISTIPAQNGMLSDEPLPKRETHLGLWVLEGQEHGTRMLDHSGQGDGTMTGEHKGDPLLSRRAALRSGAVGAGVVGAAWLAPAVTGIGLGNAHAASGPPDRVSPRGPGNNRGINSGNNPGLGHG
jgi:hypothetical protein